MSLLCYFSEIKDTRRKEGRRVSLPQILTMTFLSYLCGYYSYRKMMKFCQANDKILIPLLDLKHGVPSYITFRDVLQRLDEQECIEAFNLWAVSYSSNSLGDFISGDGKSLRSTLKDVHKSSQNFKSVVSLFAQKSGLVQQISVYQRDKNDEILVLCELLASIKNMGLCVRLDALHCQKKL